MIDLAPIVDQAERELTAAALRLLGVGAAVGAPVMLCLSAAPDVARSVIAARGRIGFAKALADGIRENEAKRAGSPGAGRIDPMAN